MLLYQPAVLQKNYGDGHVKTKLLFEATKIPLDVKSCGEKATTAFGCPKRATVFRPLRKQNKRFNSGGLKLSATIRDAVLERYPIADYEAHDPTYIDLVEEETIANDKVGTPFLFRYGVTTSKEVPYYRKNAKAVDVDSLMKLAVEFGVTTKKKVAQLDPEAVLLSLIANSIRVMVLISLYTLSAKCPDPPLYGTLIDPFQDPLKGFFREPKY